MAASVWSGQNPREVFLSGYLNFLPNLFEAEYSWIFSVFKMGIFIEKKRVLSYIFNFQKQSFADVL